jgi:hypothetical protein
LPDANKQKAIDYYKQALQVIARRRRSPSEALTLTNLETATALYRTIRTLVIITINVEDSARAKDRASEARTLYNSLHIYRA